MAEYDILLVNGESVAEHNALTFSEYTTYPSAYVVLKGDAEYTKHYFAGSQRIVSKIGEKSMDVFFDTPGARKAKPSEAEKGFSASKLQKLQLKDLKYHQQ